MANRAKIGECNIRLCSKEWWQAVLDVWNSSDYRELLKGFGNSTFIVLDTGMSVSIYWNRKGTGNILLTSKIAGNRDIQFIALLDQWKKFIKGDFNASTGVMTGKIRIEGDITKVLPYAESFTKIAEVAKSVTDSKYLVPL